MFLPTRHFSPFKLFLDLPSATAIMLNPKVLTTFTRSLLADGFTEHLGYADPSDWRWRSLSVPRRFPVAPVSQYASFILQPDRYDLFAFVRNPWGRLVSAWRNKFLDGHTASADGADFAYPRSIRQHHLKPLRRFAADNDLPGSGVGTLVPFETYLHYLLSRPTGKRDHHWDAQTRVLMIDRLTYTAIWRIEDERDDGFLTLAARLKFPEAWVKERLARPANPSLGKATVFSPALAELALPLVAEDLARFGYSADSWQGL
jgi:hypothetical protein